MTRSFLMVENYFLLCPVGSTIILPLRLHWASRIPLLPLLVYGPWDRQMDRKKHMNTLTHTHFTLWSVMPNATSIPASCSKCRLSGKFRKCGSGDETTRLKQPLTPVSQNIYLPKANILILSHILILTAALPLLSGATSGEKEASLFSLPQCSYSAWAWLDFILASATLSGQTDLFTRR